MCVYAHAYCARASVHACAHQRPTGVRASACCVLRECSISLETSNAPLNRAHRQLMSQWCHVTCVASTRHGHVTTYYNQRSLPVLSSTQDYRYSTGIMIRHLPSYFREAPVLFGACVRCARYPNSLTADCSTICWKAHCRRDHYLHVHFKLEVTSCQSFYRRRQRLSHS